MKNKSSICYLCSLQEKYIIKEYKNFTLLIDPFPITIGHMMIVSNEHYGCIGELPIDLLKDLKVHLEVISNNLKNQNKDIIFYEHGRAGVCAKDLWGFQCSHMHLHVLPLSLSLHDKLEKLFFSQQVHNLLYFREFFHAFGEYLYFQKNNIGKLYNINQIKILPHLLRTFICEKINMEHLSDWEVYKDHLLIKKNIDFKNKIKNHYEKNNLFR